MFTLQVVLYIYELFFSAMLTNIMLYMNICGNMQFSGALISPYAGSYKGRAYNYSYSVVNFKTIHSK